MTTISQAASFDEKKTGLTKALTDAKYPPTTTGDGGLVLNFTDATAPSVAQLLTALTEDFFSGNHDIRNWLPAGLSQTLQDIKLYTLSLTPGADENTPFSFSITLGWIGWSDPTLPVSLEALKVTITLQGGVFSGVLEADRLHLKNVPLDITVSATVPGFLVTAELQPANATNDQLLTALTASELSGRPTSSRTPTLSDLTIRAALHEPRVLVHLAVDDLIDLEHFVVNRAQVDLLYDGPAKTVALAAWAVVEIPYGNDQALDLLLGAEVEIPLGGTGASTSWALYGSTIPGTKLQLGDLLASLAATLTSTSKDTLPEFISSLTLQSLALGYSVDGAAGTKTFKFDCALLFDVTDTLTAQLTVTVNFTKSDASTTHAFEGKLVVGRETFTVDVTSQAQANTFIQLLLARYQHQGPLNLGALTANVAPADLSGALDGIELDINEVLFAILSAAPKPKRYLFGVDFGLDIDLTKLPVVGELFGGEDFKIDNFRFYLASDVFWLDDVKVFPADVAQRMLPSTEPPPTDPLTKPVALTKGVNFRADLTLGGAPETVPAPPGNVPDTTTEGASGAPPNPDTTGATWLNIQKKFGPVTIARIGGAYRDKHLWFYLDAALQVAVLSLTMDGLGVGVELNLDNLDPQFTIRGMSLTYQSGPIEMSGGFIANQAMDAFAGEIVVKLEEFALSALGMYADIGGFKSAFIFVMVDVPLGGPPPFFVTGLAGGFGYNTHLTLPKVEQVKDFLLVKAALPAGQSAQNPLAGKSDLTDILPMLLPSDSGGTAGNSVLTIEKGEYWFAAGVRFTSFDLINVLAMVVVEFGNELEIAVIALASISLPPPPVPGGDPVEQYAYAELAIEVLILPAQGVFQASAILTPASFVLDPNCKLTGGFAFYVWFGKNPHAGEFVLTVGGYHAHFDVPSYYPQVPRLGFNWHLSDVLTIDGEAYFALTHSAVMAGGKLEVLFHKSIIRAWLIAHLDVLISWAPFHYELSMGVSIGVEAHVKIGLISTTIKVELGVGLSLWGPSLGGKAHISYYVISFTIHFGDRNEPKPQLPWTNEAGTGFAQTLLPNQQKAASSPALSLAQLRCAPTARVLSDSPPGTQVSDSQLTGLFAINVQTGLLTQLDDTGKTWIVRPADFTFSVTTVIPALTIVDYAANEPIRTLPLPTALSYTTVPVRPMSAVLQTSQLAISLERLGDGGPDDWQRIYWIAESGDSTDVSLTYDIAYATMPAAKWGNLLDVTKPNGGNTLSEATQPLTERLVGLSGVRATSHSLMPAGADQLQFTVGDTFSYDVIATPSIPLTTQPPEKPPATRAAVADIQDALSGPGAPSRGNLVSILQGFGFLAGAIGLDQDPFSGHPEQWLYGLPLLNQD